METFEKFPLNENITLLVTEKGHVECLEYLYEKFIKYNLEHKLIWNYLIPEKAVETDHLVCLIYLINNECYFDDYTILLAAENGSLSIFMIFLILFMNYQCVQPALDN